MGIIWKRTRAAGASLAVVLFSVLAGSGNAASAHSAPLPAQCVPRSSCCKICGAGRACGNSCIRADYNCHKGRGCACDADEVCD